MSEVLGVLVALDQPLAVAFGVVIATWLCSQVIRWFSRAVR